MTLTTYISSGDSAADMDFVNPSGVLKFEASETQKSILLQIIDDDIAEVILLTCQLSITSYYVLCSIIIEINSWCLLAYKNVIVSHQHVTLISTESVDEVLKKTNNTARYFERRKVDRHISLSNVLIY